MNYLKVYSKNDIAPIIRGRTGETKLGECVQTIHSSDIKKELKKSTAKFVLLGLPEDVGVRANHGRGGTHRAWHPALSSILNIQSNHFLKGDELLILGHIDFEDLMKQANGLNLKTVKGIKTIRNLVNEIDKRVIDVIRLIVISGKTPIVIGGGHNNAFGIIKGACQGLVEAGKIKHPEINVVNSDAHADFRALEGRHSGNGFSYAFSEGYLNKYAVVALHENYNSQHVLNELKKYSQQIDYTFFEDIFIREKLSFKTAVTRAIRFTKNAYCGIELDMDSIQNIPSSSKTSSGISTIQARQYVSWCVQNTPVAYLHIAEAAPVLSHLKTDNKTGKLIAYLITDFMKASKLNALTFNR